MQNGDNAGKTDQRSEIKELKLRIIELEKLLKENKQNVETNRTAVETLGRRESELHATLYGIGDAVISTDRDGCVTRMNRTAEELTGWKENTAVGAPLEHVFRIVNETTRRPVENPATRVLREGTICGLANHTILISKDGREMPIADSGAPIFDSRQNITGVVLIFRDQTEDRLNQRFIETRLDLIEFAANHTLEELLTRALDDVGAFVDSPIGFYHFVEPDQKTLSLQQWSTRTLEEFCRAEGRGMHYGIHRAGVWVDCVREGKPVIHNDYDALPHKKGLPEGHARVVRELVVPVFRDGKMVAILGVGNKPEDYTAKDVEIVSFLADVTWEVVCRKRAKEELRRSNEMLQAIINAAPAAIVGLDLDGNVRSVWNRAAEKMFGWKTREVIGRPLPTVPENRLDEFRQFREREQNGIPMDGVDVCRQRKDGSLIDCSIYSSPFYDSKGDMVGNIAVMMDITERKQADDSVRKLTQAIEQSPVPFVITNAEGNIEFINSKFTEVTGYSRAEALGENPRILKSGETSPEEYQELWKTISSGKVWRGEFYNRKKNGEFFWENATIAPIRNSDNVITHYVGIKEDITGRKALEAQFNQAQKMESVGRLAGGVAHDFNNLLGVIIGNTELALSKMDLDQPLTAHLEEILKAAERSADLTKQLLAFARKQPVSPKVIDLNSTVEGILKMMGRLIGEDIDLSWRPAKSLWPVRIDPSQIDQILANLCVNARDAIEGVGNIIIETENISLDETYCAIHAGFSPGDYAVLTVSDTGCGIDSKILHKVFEPFFTTKELGKGTGLGLATVYGIVKQNNGFINISSEPNKGTTITIYLPKHLPESDRPKKQSLSSSVVRGHETILLVEDEPAILNMTNEMLHKFGYRVLPAPLPDEAIRMAREYDAEIHLLITDVIMPQMNGPDLADEIRSIQPNIKTLFMSGYTGNIIASHGVTADGFNFVQKPFTAQIFSKKVREVLEKG